MTKTIKRDIVSELADAFTRAKQAAIEAGKNTFDGGTCNTDHPAFRITRVSEKKIIEAASRAGVSVRRFRWFGGRWFSLNGFLDGQASQRSRMSNAATKALEEAGIEGMSVLEYCQMD